MQDIPNSVLYAAKDTYGNYIQALVPFGEEPSSVFELIEDFDGNEPIEQISVVYSSTMRSFLKIK